MRVAVAAFVSAAAAALVGCNDAPAPSSIVLSVAASGSSAAGLVDANGDVVTLTRAAICIAVVDSHAGEAVLAQRWPSAREVRDALLSFSSAYAHPGHYEAGGLMGDVEGDTVVDLLAGATTLPVGAGITGHHGSATITLCDDADLGGAVVVEGTVGADGKAFCLVVSAPEPIEGIRVDLEVEKDATFGLQIDLAALVSRVDFAQLPASTTAAPAVPAPGSQPDNAIGRAVRASSSYHFTLLP